ncbi:hypothetical protein AZE42_10959 [Rhizopogon vesiculosus]|uniref:DUF6699 domain-containing protein n=1 Tax=Rhizopogon vesiculosus TaxID=180088 RepID=A0A1J8PIW7_9AGAM|nr:hypothetical protein AZE42_10959 [Rhizopogon vesiculosus]
MISVKARRKNLGVTCGEVVEAISAYMQGDVARKEYESSPSRRRREIWSAYQFNRSTDINAPGGQLGEQLRRLDWLGSNARFGGIVRNDDFVKEACGDGDVARKEYESSPSRRRREIWSAYQFNRSTDFNAPGGQLGEQLRRLDWLGSNARFGGIVRSDDFVKEACGDVLPCTFEHQCIHNYPLNQEEAAEQRRRHAQDRSRPRSAGSTRSSRGRTIVEEVDDEDDEDEE